MNTWMSMTTMIGSMMEDLKNLNRNNIKHKNNSSRCHKHYSGWKMKKWKKRFLMFLLMKMVHCQIMKKTLVWHKNNLIKTTSNIKITGIHWNSNQIFNHQTDQKFCHLKKNQSKSKSVFLLLKQRSPIN